MTMCLSRFMRRGSTCSIPRPAVASSRRSSRAVFVFQAANDALACLETGRAKGKVVVQLKQPGDQYRIPTKVRL